MSDLHSSPHTLSHLSLEQQATLALIDSTYDSLGLALDLLAQAFEKVTGPARVYALALERDAGPPGATMYVEKNSPRRAATKTATLNRSEILIARGGAPVQLPLTDLEVIDVGAAEADEAAGRGEQWVSQLRDRLARNAALELYRKRDKDRDQPPWVSDRAPGVICAGDDRGAIAKAVRDVNARKQAFKKAVQGLVVPRRSGKDTRHRLIADHLPALRDTHLTQTYREIQYIDEEVDRMTFGWSRDMRIVLTRSIAEVIQELSGYNRVAGEGRVERELEAAGVEWLARVQSIPPFPIVNVWPLRPQAGQDKVQSVRYSAIMPIILRQAHLPPIYKPLLPFDATAEPARKRAAKKLEDEPVFVLKNTGIAFYRYREGAIPKKVMKAEDERRKREAGI